MKQEIRDKKGKGRSPKSPSPENIFWFDCGRSYQAGLTLSLSKVPRLSLEEFIDGCQMILIRYLDAKREDVIKELYAAFMEGYQKGEAAKEEEFKMIPWGIA